MDIVNIIDISVPLSNKTHQWPGVHHELKLDKIKQINNGDHCNLSRVQMSLHSGTHIDAPSHYLDNGETIDNIEVSRLCGVAYVFDLTHLHRISAEDIDINKAENASIYLLKTSNSNIWQQGKFNKDYVHIDEGCAEKLAAIGLTLVGIDYLSIEEFESELHTVHKTLLSKGIIILEGLNLSSIEEGKYELYCLPLNICNAEAAPARAVLVQQRDNNV